MEPACGLEPSLRAWSGWQLRHFPHCAPVVRANLFAAARFLDAARCVVGPAAISGIRTTQMLCNGLHQSQQMWLQWVLSLNEQLAARGGQASVWAAEGSQSATMPTELSPQEIDRHFENQAA